MKTALNLPDELFRELKVRAASEGRKLKDVIAEVLRAGLAASGGTPSRQRPRVGRDRTTGLPVVNCRPPSDPTADLTPEKVARILLEQETSWQREAGR